MCASDRRSRAFALAFGAGAAGAAGALFFAGKPIHQIVRFGHFDLALERGRLRCSKALRVRAQRGDALVVVGLDGRCGSSLRKGGQSRIDARDGKTGLGLGGLRNTESGAKEYRRRRYEKLLPYYLFWTFGPVRNIRRQSSIEPEFDSLTTIVFHERPPPPLTILDRRRSGVDQVNFA